MRNPQSAYTYQDFPVGTKVKIICHYRDFYFWYGEKGKVIENTGKYLGISVELNKPRLFEGKPEPACKNWPAVPEWEQTEFNFRPTDLEPMP